MNKLKKGDQVIVTSGKDKGTIGTIEKVIEREDRKLVVVSGVNLQKKHFKGRPGTNEESQIKQISLPIDYSNVRILNPETNKIDKVKFSMVDGVKTRVYRSSGQPIVVADNK